MGSLGANCAMRVAYLARLTSTIWASWRCCSVYVSMRCTSILRYLDVKSLGEIGFSGEMKSSMKLGSIRMTSECTCHECLREVSLTHHPSAFIPEA